MADLIDRDALMKEICGNECTNIYDEECANLFCNYYDYIIGFPVVNRWISVKDELPEMDKLYIAYAETTKYLNHNEILKELRIKVLYFDGKEWYDEEGTCYNVLYYMPLPEPPEKG